MQESPAAEAGESPGGHTRGEMGSRHKPSRVLGRRLIHAADTLTLLDEIRNADGALSVQGLHQSMKLTRPKVQAALRSLNKRGLIDTTPAGPARVSLRAQPGGIVLAVDLGGTKLRAALANRHGDVVYEMVVPTVQTDVTTQVVELYTELLRRTGRVGEHAMAVGMAIPAPYDAETDSLWNAGNLPVLVGSRPAASLRNALGMPVVIAQDARLAAVGERWRGYGRGCDDFVVICVGTGIGMGIVLNGEIYGGGLGGAGEICFLPIGNDPFAPEHRTRGPFEDAVSGPAMASRYAAEIGANDGPPGSPPDARALFEAASRGEQKAASEVERAAALLALGIAAVKATLDPGLVVLGGGVGSNPALLEPVRRHVNRLTDRPPRVEISPLTNAGPLVGAIAVALGRAQDSARLRR